MQAKKGDTVHVHYRGTLDDGTEFDSSEGSEPIVFTIGAGQVIPGFEDAIEGMSAGDKKTEKIESGNAYGERRDELVFTVPRDQMPEGTDVEVGDMLRSYRSDARVGGGITFGMNAVIVEGIDRALRVGMTGEATYRFD